MTAVLSNLWDSLRRTADHFGDEVDFREREDGSYEAIFCLQLPMTENARTYAKAYIREYLLQSGWKTVFLSIKDRQVRLVLRVLSRASSRVSKKE